MKRRQFLALSTLTLATSATFAKNGKIVEFTPEGYRMALESGAPFLLDFTASW